MNIAPTVDLHCKDQYTEVLMEVVPGSPQVTESVHAWLPYINIFYARLPYASKYL